MNYKYLKEGFIKHLKKICSVPRKLCNTIYYMFSRKENLLVVNASVFQFMNKLRHFNIGDDLNVYMLKELTGKKVFVYNQFFHRSIPNYMFIGSTIDWMANEQTIIWGAGLISPPSLSKSKRISRLCPDNIYAVRGQYTKECLIQAGIKCKAIYGDPALLLPYIYNPKVEVVKGRIGFIPHFYDIKDDNLSRLVKDCGENALVIKVQNYDSWKNFVCEILSCEFIISSSLHGLIISDAYKVPNIWVSFAHRLKGGSFKFNDYYSAVGKQSSAFEITDKTRLIDLLDKKKEYKYIQFDPKPLIKACPFRINHPAIICMK